MSRRAALAILLVAAPSLTAQTQPRVEVRLDPPSATVGDLVTATIEVRDAVAGGGRPTFPSWGERWGEAEIVAVLPQALAARQSVTLRAFRTGRLPLPPVSITLDSPRGPITLRTPADLTLDIRSVLPEPSAPGAAIAPRPAAPPRPLPVGEAFLWSAAAGTALCLVALALLLWRRRVPDATLMDVDAPAPLVELEASLAALSAIENERDIEPAHVALSAAVRRYLGRRFDFPALESTTTEIRTALSRRAGSTRVWHEGGGGPLLQTIDQVKFARRPATRAELAERVARSLALCRALEPRPIETSEAAA